MADIRIVQVSTAEAVTFDWLQTPVALLDETQELATAVTIALGTDARAKADDVLPDIDSDDRRGWWGDLDAETVWGGWPIGSRIWLLSRAKITDKNARQGSTLAKAEEYVREALAPFIAKGIASKVAVKAVRTAIGRIDVTATLYRGPLSAVQLQFQDVWAEIGT